VPPRSWSRLGPCSRSRPASFLVGEPAIHFVENGVAHNTTGRAPPKGSYQEARGGWLQHVVDGGIVAINSLSEFLKSLPVRHCFYAFAKDVLHLTVTNTSLCSERLRVYLRVDLAVMLNMSDD